MLRALDHGSLFRMVHRKSASIISVVLHDGFRFMDHGSLFRMVHRKSTSIMYSRILERTFGMFSFSTARRTYF
jgi:hypothetical protein